MSSAILGSAARRCRLRRFRSIAALLGRVVDRIAVRFGEPEQRTRRGGCGAAFLARSHAVGGSGRVSAAEGEFFASVRLAGPIWRDTPVRNATNREDGRDLSTFMTLSARNPPRSIGAVAFCS